MIYKEEIEFLAIKLRKFQDVFIFGQSGIGKTHIVNEYLNRLNFENNRIFHMVTLNHMDYITGGMHRFLEKELDELKKFYNENKNEYKEFIFDDFKYIQIGQPESTYNEFLEFINNVLLEDTKTRCIFVTQRIKWDYMNIIDNCNMLYLGKTPVYTDLRKYKNFTRTLDFTNKNFEVIEK